MTFETSLDRLRASISEAGQAHAVLSHPETLAALGCFESPTEDWPVSNPFVTVPALLYLCPDDAVLIVADFHSADVRPSRARVVTYRSYDFERRPDPAGELRAALVAVLEDGGLGERPIGIEARHLPYTVADWLDQTGRAPVACDDIVAAAQRAGAEADLEAVRRACRLADVVQQAVKDHAAPGLTEAELAGLAAAAMFREAGRRVPAILTVTTGAEATATGGGVATARPVAAGDLVLTDTSPWIDGGWSDTANAVFVGDPDRVTQKRFDAVRRALNDGISLCRPGVVAKDVDRRVREMLAEHGPTYNHHTGHRIGAAWSEEPRITPYCDERFEEGMVLALEPAIYLPGWGGIRLEHVFLVGADGNEVLTRFEHTL
ncbi:MAG TPA: M24 family metallopeptidase [Gaiellaceae bacterium]|jgi:Xaa-Pro aminopeptidase|nr:M24 family metallopeptidase [Gaiellaceae bacterium]